MYTKKVSVAEILSYYLNLLYIYSGVKPYTGRKANKSDGGSRCRVSFVLFYYFLGSAQLTFLNILVPRPGIYCGCSHGNREARRNRTVLTVIDSVKKLVDT